MSTSIIVPASVLLPRLPAEIERLEAWLKEADKNLESARSSPDPFGYVRLSAMSSRNMYQNKIDSIRVLQRACEQGWQISLGEEHFYLLTDK